jgi:hypothetical protein
MHDYDDVRFMYVACSHQLVTVFDITDRYLVPRSVEHALDLADLNLEYRAQAKDGKILQAPGVHMFDEMTIELIDSYLNGPRTLSNDRLSYLVVSPHMSPTDSTENTGDCDFLICATHFLGDGMALHQFANDFFSLLGSSSTTSDLAMLLSKEWHTRCAKADDPVSVSRHIIGDCRTNL